MKTITNQSGVLRADMPQVTSAARPSLAELIKRTNETPVRVTAPN
jgi:hypothetical protein